MISEEKKREILAQVDKVSLTQNQKMELEARFGQIGQSETNFKISQRVFLRLLSNFKSKYPFTYVHSKDSYYREDIVAKDKARERYSVIYGDQENIIDKHRLVKTNLNTINIPEFNIRIGFSIEETDNEKEPEAAPKHIRIKKRWSFIIKNEFVLDMTEVTKYQGLTKEPHENFRTSYEIELEVLNMDDFDQKKLDLFLIIIKLISNEIAGTSLSYTSDERQTLINRINRLLGSQTGSTETIDPARLTQARNLKARDMVKGGLIPSSKNGVNYTVTAKADGIRKLFVIDQTGLYLVMAPWEVNKIFAFTKDQLGIFKPFFGTILECEWIPKEKLAENADQKYKDTNWHLLIYDVLAFKGRNIQKNAHLTRLESADQIVNLFSKSTKLMILEKKEFKLFETVDDFYQSVNYILDKRWHFQTDGLVFTPQNYQYNTGLFGIDHMESRKLTNHPDICKWKPIMTIDFKIFHRSDGNGHYVELYTSNGPFLGTNDIPFNVRNGVKLDPMIMDSPNETIIEMAWDYDLNAFKALRIRDDKVQPNRKSVADDDWEDIHRPILETIMRGLSFGLSFRYHNRVKWELFSEIKNLTSNQKEKVLLDVGSGKGEDIYKIINAGFTFVYFVEPNAENREELERRLLGVKNKIKYQVLALNAITDWQQIAQIVLGNHPEGVDAITYMLSLSFFFGTEEGQLSILYLIHNTLKVGGVVAMLTLDKKAVLDFFAEDANWSPWDDNSKRANFRAIDYRWFPEKDEIFINIPDSIVKNQTEWLPDVELIQGSFEQIGLTLLKRAPTDEEFMTLEERFFVRQFSQILFKREFVPQ